MVSLASLLKIFSTFFLIQVNNNFLSAGNANKEVSVTPPYFVAKYISVLLLCSPVADLFGN